MFNSPILLKVFQKIEEEGNFPNTFRKCQFYKQKRSQKKKKKTFRPGSLMTIDTNSSTNVSKLNSINIISFYIISTKIYYSGVIVVQT